jgi:hypothetical protein
MYNTIPNEMMRFLARSYLLPGWMVQRKRINRLANVIGKPVDLFLTAIDRDTQQAFSVYGFESNLPTSDLFDSLPEKLECQLKCGARLSVHVDPCNGDS